MDEMNAIGKRLKQARIEKGYTLEDVQQLTKIQKRYLISIEENRLEELPGEFFVKTLIRQYAEALGMESTGSLPVFSENGIQDQDIESTKLEKKMPSRVEMKRESKRKRFTYSGNSQNSLPTFLMVLFIILILGMIWWFFYYSKEDPTFSFSTNGTADQSQQVSSIVKESASNTKIEEKASVLVEEATDYEVHYILRSIDLPTTLTLETDSTGRSWMNVVLDDQVVFEGTLEAGVTHTIELPEDLKTLSMRIGYLPSTTIRFGKDLIVPKPENNQTIQTQNFYFRLE